MTKTSSFSPWIRIFWQKVMAGYAQNYQGWQLNTNNTKQLINTKLFNSIVILAQYFAPLLVVYHLGTLVSRGKSLGRRYKEPCSGWKAVQRARLWLICLCYWTAHWINAHHYTELHFTTLHWVALHYTALICTTLHYSALSCTTLHYTALSCNALHCSVRKASSAPVSTVVFLVMKGSNVRCWHCTSWSVDTHFITLSSVNNTIQEKCKGINVQRTGSYLSFGEILRRGSHERV